MAPRKKTTLASTSSEEIMSNSKHPLVFISHDTRDAELAEEFSNLLKSASAGALKSFRSSDKKGTQGIEYGQEWYPAIMEKIDEASDVVCLLTHRSVDRPWILYEAGVAKGKLDKKVIGIALGIPFSSAVTGPFAQFQNNDGDVESITRLVLDLVRKVPGLDPDESLVKQLVESFVKKCEEINSRLQNKESDTDKTENVDENSVAKLFEEVKIMFDALPSKIENRIDPDFRRRRRKFHPLMLEELVHIGGFEEDPGIGFLMLLGFFKDEIPWFYEFGLESYRNLKTVKTSAEKERILMQLEKASEILSHPVVREFQTDSKESYMLYKEGSHLFRRYLNRWREFKK